MFSHRRKLTTEVRGSAWAPLTSRLTDLLVALALLKASTKVGVPERNDPVAPEKGFRTIEWIVGASLVLLMGASWGVGLSLRPDVGAPPSIASQPYVETADLLTDTAAVQAAMKI